MRTRIFLVLLICLALLIPFKVNGQQTANSFQYPLSSYQVGCNDFWGTCVKAWHLGEDVSALAGTPVYAPADGTVKHVNVRAQYGNVIVIEHKIPNDFVCTVMGHLRPDVKVSVGQYVTKGQLLGYLGTRLQNGGWDEHIHFGINKSNYSGDYSTTCGSDWVYGGYRSCNLLKMTGMIPLILSIITKPDSSVFSLTAMLIRDLLTSTILAAAHPLLAQI